MQKAKWLSEEAIQTAMERREVKGKRENITIKCRVPKKIARRDKKAFLSNQCEEIRGKQ